MRDKAYAIVGGYDRLSSSVFNTIQLTKNKSVFINVSNDRIKDKRIYNFNIYELEKIINCLRNNKIKNICITGKVSRPNLDKIKIDKLLSFYMPKILSAYKDGDDKILKVISEIFISEGFNLVSIKEISKNFFFSKKFNSSQNLSKQDYLDIRKGSKILDTISKYDNAQSIIISNGYILGIEAVEGTDKLIKRVIIEKKILKLDKAEGFLIKLPKKNQINSIDPPVIGPNTINLASKCNLNGIAINKAKTVVFNIDKVVKLLNDKKMKIYFI